MPAHNGLDGLRSLVSTVEGNAADVVVQNVSLDNAVEQVATDEAKLAVNGCSGTLDEGPFFTGIVRQGRIGVLEEGDGNCSTWSANETLFFDDVV